MPNFTEYSMLALTRGFIENSSMKRENQGNAFERFHHLSEQIQDFENFKSLVTLNHYFPGIDS